MIDLNVYSTAQWPASLHPLIEAARLKSEKSFAGAELAKLRRDAKTRHRQRVYTGVIGNQRAWRNMKVILPDGSIGTVYFARRGAAVVLWRDELALKPDKVGACKTAELRRYKCPAAVILGACKHGVKERPSAQKAKAARINGCCPPRPGNRPRGRPAKKR
jgi:hypothetical protein